MIDTTSIDLAALAERDGVTLHGQAERYGACPKCGGRDRFHVRIFEGRGFFFCRACHPRRGDAIEYMQWLHGMTVPEACAALGLQGQSGTLPARRPPPPKTAAGIEIPESLPEPPPAEWQDSMRQHAAVCSARLWSPAGARALAYLRSERLLTDATIRAFGLGFCDADDRARGLWRGITIPHSYGGALWGINTRRASGVKYLKVTGSRSTIFNGDTLATEPRAVVIVGGEFDAMLCAQHAPHGVAVVTPGSETTRPSWEADYLLRGKRVLIAFDCDQAGEKGAAAWLALGARARVPSGKDATDFLGGGGDLGAWLAEVTGTVATAGKDDTDQLHEVLIDSLFRMGYSPRFGADGRIIAAREELATS